MSTPSVLWRCPKCGHQFVTRHLWHSCVRVPIERHFDARPPALRATFRALTSAAGRLGPVTIYGQKTRIVFQARVRFASVTVRAAHLDFGLWMTRAATHPKLAKTEALGALGYGVHLHLSRPSDVDAALRRLFAESYRTAVAGPRRRRT